MKSVKGPFSYDFFEIFLEREIRRFERYGAPFCLAFVETGSKTPLDEADNGPAGGVGLVNLILNNIREVDLVAQCGEQRFAVVLTETTINNAYNVAERIRSSIANSTGASLDVSIGLAACPRDARSSEQLVQKARETLQAALTKGDNQIQRLEHPTDTAESWRPRILLVDDSELNLKMLAAMLMPLKYEVLTADHGQAALDAAASSDVDLILLDVMMPGMDGFEVCRRLKSNAVTRMIPVVLVTTLDDTESRVQGLQAGADDFITKPPNKMELTARVNSLIRLKKLYNDFASLESVLFSLARAVEAKDVYTQGHVERVASMAETLGRMMNLSSEELRALKYGGILHDIGKIGIPNAILNKPGPLDDEEWAAMKTHPLTGYRICLPLKQLLGPALEVIRHHHEKLDGSGYPDGLEEEDISMVARIMAVADIYDALVTDRPYRKGMSREKALDILSEEAESGKLDDQVVGLLHQLVNMGAAEAAPAPPAATKAAVI